MARDNAGNQCGAEVRRTHDHHIYLKENRYEEPKEQFKMIGGLIREFKAGRKGGIDISDWGCAAGEFAYYLRRTFPDDTITGYEFLPELVRKARERVPGVDFVQGSVFDRDAAPENSSDVITVVGVLSIFDDISPPLDNLIRWTRPGGKIFILGMFNKHPVDVFVKYRHATDAPDGALESGWNIISRSTVDGMLEKRGQKAGTYHDFEMPFDLPPNPEDCVRSWTEARADGSRVVTNGLCLAQPISILEITVKQAP